MGKRDGQSAVQDDRKDTWKEVACLGLVFVVAVLQFAETAGAGFVWDDRAAIVGNKDLRAESPWSQLLVHDFWGQDITMNSSHKSFRPVTVGTYRLNYAVHGDDPMGYHVVNVALHAVVTVLVSVLARLLTGSRFRSTLAGLLFAVHPVHVEAVAGIVGRAELMGTLFYMCSILSYMAVLHAQRPGPDEALRWYKGWVFLAVAAVTFALGIFSKENGITALAAFFLLETVYRPTLKPSTSTVSKSPTSPSKNGPTPATAAPTATTAATAATTTAAKKPSVFADLGWALDFEMDSGFRLATMLVWTAIIMSYRLSVHAGAALYSWTILENQMSLMPPGVPRALTVLYTHALYGRLLVWPQWLAFDWGFGTIAPISGLTDPRNLVTVFAYAVLATAVWLSLRHRNVAALFGLGAAVASFVPASNLFLWVGTELAERLLYMPTVGLAVAVVSVIPTEAPTWLVATWLSLWGRQLKVNPAKPRASSHPFAWPLVVLALVLMAGRSHLRNQDWMEERRVYETGIDVCPRSVKALNNLSFLLLEGSASDWDRAEGLLLRAVEIWPDHSSAFFNLAIVSLRRKDVRTSHHWFWQSVGAGYPTPGNVHMHLGEQYLNMHVDQQAKEPLTWSIQAGGAVAEAWIAANVPPTEDGRYTCLNIARAHYEQASRLGVNTAKNSLGRGNVARELGYYESAIRELEMAVQQAVAEDLPVIRASAYSMLALTYEALGDGFTDQADAAFKASIDAAPNDANLHSNAANFWAKRGLFDLAMHHHEQAVTLQPNSAILINNYGYGWELAGRYDQALMAYEQALLLIPDHGLIQNNVNKMKGLLQQQQQQQQHPGL